MSSLVAAIDSFITSISVSMTLPPPLAATPPIQACIARAPSPAARKPPTSFASAAGAGGCFAETAPSSAPRGGLATRSKLRQGDCEAGARLLPPELERLTELVEANYRRLHSPADYAALLHVTPKTLGRLVRKWLGKTPTDLIRDSILKHAKW